MGTSSRLFLNPRFVTAAAYPDPARQVVSLGALESAWDEARAWPGYAPTPLHGLAALATELDVAEILLKDESERFGLGSFKAIGGAYGALRVVQSELGLDAPPKPHDVADACAVAICHLHTRRGPSRRL